MGLGNPSDVKQSHTHRIICIAVTAGQQEEAYQLNHTDAHHFVSLLHRAVCHLLHLGTWQQVSQCSHPIPTTLDPKLPYSISTSCCSLPPDIEPCAHLLSPLLQPHETSPSPRLCPSARHCRHSTGQGIKCAQNEGTKQAKCSTACTAGTQGILPQMSIAIFNHLGRQNKHSSCSDHLICQYFEPWQPRA